MSERFKRWPEVVLGTSTVLGAAIGYVAVRDRQGDQQRERLAYAQELNVERNEWYAGTDGLEESAKNRDVFMASLPEGCEDALKPFYFDSETGRDVESRDVVASIKDTCDIGPYDVVVARETINNIARLFTVIEELDTEIAFNKNYQIGSVEKYSERGAGLVLGAAFGLLFPFMGRKIVDLARWHINDQIINRRRNRRR